MPKILVLVSEYPYFDWMKKIITDFYDYFKGSGINNVIEAHAFNVVFKIVAPQRDQKAVKYQLLNVKEQKEDKESDLDLSIDHRASEVRGNK
jgi:hypothetical protein